MTPKDKGMLHELLHEYGFTVLIEELEVQSRMRLESVLAHRIQRAARNCRNRVLERMFG